MDPRSIAASSLAFIGACQKLATALKFLHDLSRAPEEVCVLIDELNDFQHVLTAIALVTRKRQDEVFEIMLSPLFAKADRVFRELCEACGACPHTLKEKDDCTKQLKAQLLARFKWARAKSRIGELRERLKIIRQEFSNSLGVIGLTWPAQIFRHLALYFTGALGNAHGEQLLIQFFSSIDHSRIISQLSTLTIGLFEPVASTTLSDPDLPPRYESSSMQIFSVEQPKLVEVEAQGQPDFVAEKDSALLIQKPSNLNSRSTVCKRACSCSCHSVYRLGTPSLLQALVGSLLIKSNGLYGLNQPCNEFSCRRSSSATVRISYRFPGWMLNRMISSLIVSNRLSGPQLSLVIPRVVPNTSDIFFHAFTGNVDGVAKLLQSGLASPCDISDGWGYTALHYAVEGGHMDLCRFLLQAGARPQITDTEGTSVTDKVWNRICSGRIPPTTATRLEEMFKKDEWFEERQFTTLHKIVLNLLVPPGNLDEELSVSTREIEIADSEGRSPLSWAAESGNAAAVATLLLYGAKTSSKSVLGMTPLHYAAQAPNSACLFELLKHGVEANHKNKWNQSPLNIASYFQNDASYIAPLLDHGADIHERDYYSSTALSNALFMNNHHTARCLISEGANIHDLDGQGLTGLNDAIENNSHDCISLLFDSGVNLAIVGLDDETALHVLARRGDLYTMEIFQAADLEGLDPEAKTKRGLKAWDLMRQRVDVDDETQSAFRSLMTKLDPKSNCVTFYDALEKMPHAIGKVPDQVEVKVEEILVNYS